MRINKLKKESYYIEAYFNIYLEIILIDDNSRNLRKISVSFLNFSKVI